MLLLLYIAKKNKNIIREYEIIEIAWNEIIVLINSKIPEKVNVKINSFSGTNVMLKY